MHIARLCVRDVFNTPHTPSTRTQSGSSLSFAVDLHHMLMTWMLGPFGRIVSLWTIVSLLCAVRAGKPAPLIALSHLEQVAQLCMHPLLITTILEGVNQCARLHHSQEEQEKWDIGIAQDM